MQGYGLCMSSDVCSNVCFKVAFIVNNVEKVKIKNILVVHQHSIMDLPMVKVKVALTSLLLWYKVDSICMLTLIV